MVIDFHSHILPQIDDGSSSVQESVAMLEMEAAQGVAHVVATPHFYAQHDTPEHFLRKRNASELVLREAMQEHEGLPEISIGAEVYYFRGISDSEVLPKLTIGDSRYILVEMPMGTWTDSMCRELADIREKQGLTPIIAHIDRYIGFFRTHSIMDKLEHLPILIQANASFFTRLSTRELAIRLLREKRIHLLGSDCHNLTTRAPNLLDAVRLIERRLGKAHIERINYYENEILTHR